MAGAMTGSDQREIGDDEIGHDEVDDQVDADERAALPTGDGGEGDAAHADDPDDAIVLPWYYSWWRMSLVAIAATLFAVGAGLALTDDGSPAPDSVDVGFLQDMRSHHDQAVLMSLIYLNRPDTDPGLYTMATEVLLSQQMEIGIFVEVLRSFGAAEENSNEVAMAWMGAPVPLDAMPGMASEQSLDRLRQSTGAEADDLFTQLMIAHHEGGIHMGEYAAAHAGRERVRDIADAVVRNQTSEITELTAALARSRSA